MDLKKLIVFIFLFAVVERTGYGILSLISQQSGFEIQTILGEIESKNTSKEAEEKSLKEYWFDANYQTSLQPLLRIIAAPGCVKDFALPDQFHLSVPNPPPNILVV